MRITCTAPEGYQGTDAATGRPLNLAEGESVEVSDEKAIQLMEDFPGWFDFEDPPPAEDPPEPDPGPATDPQAEDPPPAEKLEDLTAPLRDEQGELIEMPEGDLAAEPGTIELAEGAERTELETDPDKAAQLESTLVSSEPPPSTDEPAEKPKGRRRT